MKDKKKIIIESLAIKVKRLVNEQVGNIPARKGIYNNIMEFKMSNSKRLEDIPEVTNDDVSKAEFEYYYEKWLRNTMLYSNLSIIFGDENYKNIIDMGKRAVLYICNILKQMPSFIVFALEEIYGYTLNIDNRFSLDELCEKWIKEIESKEDDKH